MGRCLRHCRRAKLVHRRANVTERQKSLLATLCCGVGLGLSIYLALLKYFALPCVGPGSCQAVIHSRFGSALGIPVGVFGAVLWLGAILVRDATKRAALLLLLAAGAAVFMVLQFAVLRGFCLYCTLHAASAWAAFALRQAAPHRAALALGLALAASGFFATRAQVAARVEHAAALAAPHALDGRSVALPWLGELSDRSPTLILSLNCPVCLDLLAEVAKGGAPRGRIGPVLLLKTNDENRGLTTTFLAAVLAQEGKPRDAFLGVTAFLLMRKDAALSSPGTAMAELAALFPAALERQSEAAALVEKHARVLQAARLGDTTPMLVPPGGKPTPYFKTEALFPTE